MIDSSKVLSSDDIFDQLISLKYGESPLVEWKIEGGDTMLLVSTLQRVDWMYADIEIGSNVTTPSSTDGIIWVTIPGELNQELQGEDVKRDSTSVNNRLLELLGLRPDDSESVVNLLWVNKNSILRPSYNPETQTTYGAVEYPLDETLPTWYREWFEGNITYSYESPEEGLNYPFTRLGYTYDWGCDSDKYGLSEFIITPSSVIKIERRISCWDYYRELLLELLESGKDS